MTKVVLAQGLYNVTMDVQIQLEENYGISNIDDMLELPRHDPRLVECVEDYIKRHPDQDFYEIVTIDSNRYIIHEDDYGDTIYTDNSPKWINI